MDLGELYFDLFGATPAAVRGGNGDHYYGRRHGIGRGMYEYGD